MALAEIRAALGIERVIWIDDRLVENPPDLLAILLANPTAGAGFGEVAALLAADAAGADVSGELEQRIADLPSARRDALLTAALAAEATDGDFASQELSEDVADEVCALLEIAEGDRWSFKDAADRLPAIAGKDATVCYVIDLSEAAGDDRRGAEILADLVEKGCLGTPFILTHATDAAGEGALETELVAGLPAAAGGETVPVTVVAKGRLEGGGDAVERALEIGFKRAGLRKALRSVVQAARQTILDAFDASASLLYRIPPESLERHVFDRGAREGTSELHVVERALTAGVSRRVREFFATDGEAIAAGRVLRRLRGVTLEAAGEDAAEPLGELRRAETWDDEPVINGAFSPLANGDVFQCDTHEPEKAQASRALHSARPALRCDASPGRQA